MSVSDHERAINAAIDSLLEVEENDKPIQEGKRKRDNQLDPITALSPPNNDGPIKKKAARRSRHIIFGHDPIRKNGQLYDSESIFSGTRLGRTVVLGNKDGIEGESSRNVFTSGGIDINDEG